MDDSEQDPVVGHKTLRAPDGRRYHEPLRRSESDSIIAQIEANDARRRDLMPTEKDALVMMFEACRRLKELGWNDAIYCPKDGTMFSAIEAGSTGIHECNYLGKWPDGSWWVYDGDVWPARPILWRPKKDDEPRVNLGPVMGPDNY